MTAKAAAPCAFFYNAFDVAADSGRLTHGHPTGYMAGGLFADILQRIVDRQDSLEDAIAKSLSEHGQKPGMKKHVRWSSVCSFIATKATAQPPSGSKNWAADGPRKKPW